MAKIRFTIRGPAAFCSNFYPAPFIDSGGVLWQTSEHYYQAHKSINPVEITQVRRAKSASKAKQLGGPPYKGGIVTMRSDFDLVKDDIMREALLYKFPSQFDNKLTKMLLSTGNDTLIEKAPWDGYWGDGRNGKGLNRLGQLLMERRDCLVDERVLYFVGS